VKKKRFSVEQIVAILKQAELGIPIAELIRQVGVSEQTFYRWKKEVQRAGGRSAPADEAAAGREHAAARLPHNDGESWLLSGARQSQRALLE